jgi:hypothetical protein
MVHKNPPYLPITLSILMSCTHVSQLFFVLGLNCVNVFTMISQHFVLGLNCVNVYSPFKSYEVI